MYIRRKVYSAFEDENGEIRYFSTNEIVNEEEYLEMLYSEDYLDDDDMERLFSFHPVTGEAISPEEYKKVLQELSGRKGKSVITKSGKMRKDVRKAIEKAAEEGSAKSKKEMLEKAAEKTWRRENAEKLGKYTKAAAKGGFAKGKASATFGDVVKNMAKTKGGKAKLAAAGVLGAGAIGGSIAGGVAIGKKKSA